MSGDVGVREPIWKVERSREVERTKEIERDRGLVGSLTKLGGISERNLHLIPTK